MILVSPAYNKLYRPLVCRLDGQAPWTPRDKSLWPFNFSWPLCVWRMLSNSCTLWILTILPFEMVGHHVRKKLSIALTISNDENTVQNIVENQIGFPLQNSF